MAEDKNKPAAKAAKPRAANKPASEAAAASAPAEAKAARAPRPVAKPASRPKPEKTVTVTQIGSPIGRRDYQRATLKGLGLDKLRRSKILEDTPAVRGMIARVRHLLRVEPAS